MPSFTIRELRDSDSIEELTDLLHRAYAGLGARGLQYLAVNQDAETTRRRVVGGECLVAEVENALAATITWHAPTQTGRGTPWYDRPDVATFGQYATDPAFQGRGIARALLDEVERRARAVGAAEIACDTAEPASDLIAMYDRRGYRIVGRTDWRPATNYESVILSKALA